MWCTVCVLILYLIVCMCRTVCFDFVVFVDECAVIVCTVCAGLPGGPARWLKGHFLSKIKIYLSIYLSKLRAGAVYCGRVRYFAE